MLEWSPSDAQVPVSAFLVVFGFLCIPASVLALLELRAADNARPKAKFQYSIAAMLVLMLVLALVLGLIQAAGHKGAAVGIALAYLVAFLYVARQFFRNRRTEKLADVSSFLEGARSADDGPLDR